MASESEHVRHHRRHHRVRTTADAQFADKVIRQVEPAGPDGGAEIGSPVLRGGLTAFGDRPAVGERFPCARSVIHVGQHPEGAEIVRIQTMGGAGGLIGFHQGAALHRLFRPAHQLVGPPAFEGPVGGQGGKAQKRQGHQKDQPQGQAALEAGAACLAFAHAHRVIVDPRQRNPKPRGGLAGKSSGARTTIPGSVAQPGRARDS